MLDRIAQRSSRHPVVVLLQKTQQRSFILIPNLVSTVSGAANFEKSTLAEVVNARASVGQVKIDPSTAPTDSAKLAEFDKAQGFYSQYLTFVPNDADTTEKYAQALDMRVESIAERVRLIQKMMDC